MSVEPMPINPEALVSDVQELLNKYGVNNVEATIAYLKNFTEYSISVKDASGKEITQITSIQYTKLREVYGSNKNKIDAIKHLRDMTYLALKDAKEGIEYLFEGK